MEHKTLALIGGLRRFRVAGTAPSAGVARGEQGAEELRLPPSKAGRAGGTGEAGVVGAAASAVPSPAPEVALFGDCQVYIPADEWEAVDRARRSSVQIVVRKRHGPSKEIRDS